MSHSGDIEEGTTFSKRSHAGDREDGTTVSERNQPGDREEGTNVSNMNQPGDREEGTTVSKMNQPGDREEGTTVSKRKRCRVHPETLDSSVPSCRSLSEHSMGRPVYFREGEGSSEHGVHPERPDSSVPSCVSMKSEHSMGRPVYFRKEEQGVPPERPGSPVPSCVSMKSDHSMGRPVYFVKEDLSSEHGHVQLMKSEWIKLQPLLRYQQDLKTKLKLKYQHISEGNQRKRTLIKEIYTDLYITEGGSGWVNEEHEVRQIEMAFNRKKTQETTINCNDIFRPVKAEMSESVKGRGLRNLTKGIAGIGKTVTVQKVILDWAEGKANQDINFMFPLPFRDLNLIKDQYSLKQLLALYFPELKDIDSIENIKTKTLFILDSLDECRLPLDFKNNPECCNVTESTSVDVLLTNLIKGNLFPSALLWITTRPVTAGLIPPNCVDQVTEIRGFNEPKKEEYLRKKITNTNLANNIIKHIKSSRTLHIMCHIPVFCWITATVLEMMLKQEEKDEIPKTPIQMYVHFILIQTSVKKYNKATDTNPKELFQRNKEMILKLSKLAFQQLQKGNLIFYEEDLRECGLDVTEASKYSALCTEIFIEESGLYQKKVFSFVHLSLQEFLAAVHALETCLGKGEHVFPPKAVTQSTFHCDDDEEDDDDTFEVRQSDKLYELYRRAVDQALRSNNGHLDLFLRFLMGLLLKSNQDLLQGLLTQTESSTQQNMETIKRTENYLSDKIKKESSPERTINLFLCLNELGANSLAENMQTSLRSGILSETKLQPHQCSALTYLLLMSEPALEEFELKRYNTSDEGYQRLLPVVKICKKAVLDSCNLNFESCKILGSALWTPNCPLKELDISNNHLEDRGVDLLCAGITSPLCKIQTLVLSRCKLTSKSCETLISALQIPNCLRHLILSYNHLEDRGVELLCSGLTSPLCNIQTLVLGHCGLTEVCCSYLASLLRSPNSPMKKLELRDNDLKDSGVTLLSDGLEDPNCKLNTLGLSGCLVTEVGCNSLASALRSNCSNLRKLDLSYNHPGDLGVKLLSARLEDPQWRLEKLIMDHGEKYRLKSGPQKYACDLTLDPNTACNVLSLSEENKTAAFAALRPYPNLPERFDYWNQVLCCEGLTGRCYWEVERNGDAVIAVTYNGISRRGKDDDSRLGYNDKSWSLDFYDNSYFAYHRSKKTSIPDPASSPWPNRVGVYLDWQAGILSFYSITCDTLSHMHTFHCRFTEPLHAGFWVGSESSVSLCPVN